MSNQEQQTKPDGGASVSTAMLGAWSPIETAPKDGTWILATIAGYIPLVVQWNDAHGKWLKELEQDCGDEEWEAVTEGYYRPSHWMPLPEAPNVK